MHISNDMGFSPLHFAAYKSQFRTCEILIDFILNVQEPNPQLDEPELTREQAMKKRVLQRRKVLKNWLNMHS